MRGLTALGALLLGAVGALAQTSITLTAFPALYSTAGSIAGSVNNLNNPSAYKIVIYLLSNQGLWWSKPHAGVSYPINADGSFSITGWSSSISDANMVALQLYVVPGATDVTAGVLGAAAPPAAVTGVSLVSAFYVAGYIPGQTMPTPSLALEPSPTSAAAASAIPAASSPAAAPSSAAASSAPPAASQTGTGTSTGTATPSRSGASTPSSTKAAVAGAFSINAMAGGGANIIGKLTGLNVAASTLQLALYVADGAGNWWGCKPLTTSTFNLNSDFTFVISNWASVASDNNVNSFTLFAVPTAFTPPAVLGAATFPATLTAAAAAKLQFTQAGNGGNVVTPTPDTAGQIAWPPATQGTPVGCQNGYISYSGFNWICKDSGGGGVGPGNNVFSSSINNLWVDNWGMHFNVIPTNGCGGPWTCSEVWLDHSLGYGTYLFRHYANVNYLDSSITWSPFFLWDDSGNANNAWNEIDFECSRWGNAGDPTSSQFVLRPLQAGGDLPGWKTRYTTTQLTVYQGSGAGTGGCNNAGQANFNGGAMNRVTCALRWFPNLLAWYCADGFYTMATFNNIPTQNLLSSYTYPYTSANIPTVGDTRIHMNLWLNSGNNLPALNMRSHTVSVGLEFTATDMGFTSLPANSNIAQRFLLQKLFPQDSLHLDTDGASLGRALQSSALTSAQQSSGDPSGSGMRTTMSQISLLAAQSTGKRVLAVTDGQSSVQDNSASTAQASAGIVVGSLFAGMVAMAAVFAIGFGVVQARNQFFVAPTVDTPRAPAAGTAASRVIPVAHR